MTFVEAFEEASQEAREIGNPCAVVYNLLGGYSVRQDWNEIGDNVACVVNPPGV